jgi:hypothetical protein
MTAVTRHAAAQDAARHYLTRVRERLQITTTQLDGGQYWRASLHAPHPGDPDTIICVNATGAHRDGAIELVRLELLGLAARHFTDPTELARERETVVYDHGTALSARHVAAAVVTRGHPEPNERDIGLAYVAMRAVGDVTVGEVATMVIGRAAAAGRTGYGPQQALM